MYMRSEFFANSPARIASISNTTYLTYVRYCTVDSGRAGDFFSLELQCQTLKYILVVLGQSWTLGAVRMEITPSSSHVPEKIAHSQAGSSWGTALGKPSRARKSLRITEEGAIQPGTDGYQRWLRVGRVPIVPTVPNVPIPYRAHVWSATRQSSAGRRAARRDFSVLVAVRFRVFGWYQMCYACINYTRWGNCPHLERPIRYDSHAGGCSRPVLPVLAECLLFPSNQRTSP